MRDLRQLRTAMTLGSLSCLSGGCSLQDFDYLGAANGLATTEVVTGTSSFADSSADETTASLTESAPLTSSSVAVSSTAAEPDVPDASVADADASSVDAAEPEPDAATPDASSNPTQHFSDAASGESSSSPLVDAAADASSPQPVVDTLENGDFEIGSDSTLPIHWLAEGTEGAATYSWKDNTGRNGPGFLDVWWDEDYTIDVYQVVSPIPNGTYSLSIWQSGAAYTEQYVYVSGYDANDPEAKLTVATVPRGDTFAELTIPAIAVTSGSVRIGVYSDGLAQAWSHFDDVVFQVVEE